MPDLRGRRVAVPRSAPWSGTAPTPSLSSCIGMWVPAGQAIGKSLFVGGQGEGGRGHRPHRTCSRRLRTTPCGKRSSPAAPTVRLLHRVHASWRVPAAAGLPPGLRRPPTIQ